MATNVTLSALISFATLVLLDLDFKVLIFITILNYYEKGPIFLIVQISKSKRCFAVRRCLRTAYILCSALTHCRVKPIRLYIIYYIYIRLEV